MHRSREEIEALKAVQVYFILTNMKLGTATFLNSELAEFYNFYTKSESPCHVPLRLRLYLYYDLR